MYREPRSPGQPRVVTQVPRSDVGPRTGLTGVGPWVELRNFALHRSRGRPPRPGMDRNLRDQRSGLRTTWGGRGWSGGPSIEYYPWLRLGESRSESSLCRSDSFTRIPVRVRYLVRDSGPSDSGRLRTNPTRDRVQCEGGHRGTPVISIDPFLGPGSIPKSAALLSPLFLSLRSGSVPEQTTKLVGDTRSMEGPDLFGHRGLTKDLPHRDPFVPSRDRRSVVGRLAKNSLLRTPRWYLVKTLLRRRGPPGTQSQDRTRQDGPTHRYPLRDQEEK